MKLILCPKCQDVMKIMTLTPRSCYCGRSWGFLPYKEKGNDLVARIGGEAIPLGFANSTLVDAIQFRPENDAGGCRFEAFVIPKNCATVEQR